MCILSTKARLSMSTKPELLDTQVAQLLRLASSYSSRKQVLQALMLSMCPSQLAKTQLVSLYMLSRHLVVCPFLRNWDLVIDRQDCISRCLSLTLDVQCRGSSSCIVSRSTSIDPDPSLPVLPHGGTGRCISFILTYKLLK